MIVVVAGVAGSGKTTIGTLLAQALGCPFADGDSFHPAANVAKMKSGEPLTDADRAPWLAAITAWMDGVLAGDQPAAVLACSALRRRYREQLLDGRDAVCVFLRIDQEHDEQRVAGRPGHFFSSSLLGSQFAALELPDPAEEKVITFVTSGQPAQELAADIIAALGLAAAP